MPPRRSVLVNVVMIAIVLMCVALATPWTAVLRGHLWPQLPILVVVLGTLSGVAEIVHGLVRLLSERDGWSRAAFSLLFGATGLLLALTFLPAATGAPPRTSTLWPAAVCAIVAGALQRRQHLRSGL